MKDEVIDVVQAAAGAFEQLVHRRRDAAEREVEDLRTIHVEVLIRAPVSAFVFALLGRRRAERLAQTTGGNDQVLRAASVGAEDEGTDEILVGFTDGDEGGRGGVAKDRAHGTVAWIDELRVRLGRDEQDARRHIAFDEALRQRETVYESGAALVEIDGAAARAQTEPVLNDAGGRRQEVVG